MAVSEEMEECDDYPRCEQLMVHSERPCEEAFNAPDPAIETLKNGEYTSMEIIDEADQLVKEMKPHDAGLWTSTETTDGSSYWTEFLTSNGSKLRNDDKVWRVIPREDISVYKIEDLDALQAITNIVEEEEIEGGKYVEGTFTARRFAIDFYTLAQEYDAVWFPRDAADAIRLTGTEYPEMSYWDIESTVWLNWCFEEVELVAESLTVTDDQ